MRSQSNRREFLKAAAAAGTVPCLGAAPYFFSPANVVGADDKAKEKNDRLSIGQIGCGGQGNHDTNQALAFGDVLAVCDVDSERTAAAKEKQGKGKADVYGDYRKILDRKDIDVVVIGTPDHWHTKILIEALQAGKDVYCEKPLTLTIDEGKLINKVVRETKRVVQVGTQQRSSKEFQNTVGICRDGRIGKIKEVYLAIGGGDVGGPFQKESPPPNLNWDMWLGQAPKVEYIKQRCHYQFRWWFEYSGGKMTDWGAHHIDIAHWALGADDTGPVSFVGQAGFPVKLMVGMPIEDNKYNTAATFDVKATFADGTPLYIRNRSDNFPEKMQDNGILIVGEKGTIFVRRGKTVGAAFDELKTKPLPAELIKKLYKGNDPTSHMQNFVNCVKSRKEPVSDVFSHNRAMETAHLANICIRLSRPIKWDPKEQQIQGDELAQSWQKREQRKGYEIKA